MVDEAIRGHVTEIGGERKVPSLNREENGKTFSTNIK